ncbi:hypothetical protein RhiirA5_437883 [Rhizophagus irregularis]|uniref:Uncharacterized protein n=1 Tax=Rhizophagus irregularis TaxID=588596 RepID=A0A2N0NJX3_9GLOM|nr:hypothetical protein RhiirA5_437883 [Rhizophagus irregularis]
MCRIDHFFTSVSRGRYENISSIYVSQKFHRIPTDIRENAMHIVLFSGGGSTRKLADIISPYIDADPHKTSKVIDGYLRQKEFVVIDINKLRSEFFLLQWDTPLNLEKEIESLAILPTSCAGNQLPDNHLPANPKMCIFLNL